MYAIYFHLVILIVLFFACMAGLILIRTHSKAAEYDRTKMYSYKKHVVNMDEVKKNLLENTTFNWLDVEAPDKNCADMRIYDWPEVWYGNSTFIPNNPSCLLQWTFADGVGGTTGSIAVQSVTVVDKTLCVDGTYTVTFRKYNPASTLVTLAAPAPAVTILNGVATFNKASSVVIGTGFVARKTVWNECVEKRSNLVYMIRDKTDCFTENSQMCSCVYMFLNRITNYSAVWPNKDQRTQKISDMLYNGIEQCKILRRARDKYIDLSPADWHRQSQILFVIVVMLVFNVIYHTINYVWEAVISKGQRIGMHIGCLFFILIVAFASGAADIGKSDYSVGEVMLSIGVIFVVSSYYEMSFLSSENYPTVYKPTVHPWVFGVVYYCLTTFILVRRGVILYDILMLEVVKAFALTLLYVKVMVFYSAVETNKLVNRIITHRSQLMAVFVMIVISLDVCFTPYGDMNDFQLVWLLPFAWVMWSIGEKMWLQYFYIGYGDDATSKDGVDIRRNLMFTGIHFLVFWVICQLFAVYLAFADIDRDKFNFVGPMMFRYKLQNGYLMPGYIREEF